MIYFNHISKVVPENLVFKIKILFHLLLILFIHSCTKKTDNSTNQNLDIKAKEEVISLVVLGTIQDAGSPHIGCTKECCRILFEDPDNQRQVVSLGIIDNISNKIYMLEATPDITSQNEKLKDLGPPKTNKLVDGIFLTHAHIGHYSGLIYLGKEAIDAKSVEVFAMPRMKNFLTTNGPWSQLVNRKNINLIQMAKDSTIKLSNELRITPFLVPHRDEYSETVGYKIEGPSKKALFIPDIDKWSKWERDIREEVKQVDYAFLDATFYSGEEINNRDISQIPHPFMIESFEIFRDLEHKEKNKIFFIHFNHTNPVLNTESKEFKLVEDNGFHIANYLDLFEL